MVALTGTYQNGQLKLDEEYTVYGPVKVIVTFLEEAKQPVKPVKQTSEIKVTDFSFAKSQENLREFTGSFGDTVVAERRAEL